MFLPAGLATRVYTVLGIAHYWMDARPVPI